MLVTVNVMELVSWAATIWKSKVSGTLIAVFGSTACIGTSNVPSFEE
jgi:hypothetical protein